jgi:divalent metal cation (Fe/Co/Zn/Cd) transporter
VLLVVVAATLAVETKSLLLGESATKEAQGRIRAAIEGATGVERIIHMKTLHLGPEELLVAAKIGVPAGSSASQVATTIDSAEQAIRAGEPTARAIYLEPDIYRETYEPAARPQPPASAGH